MKRTISQKQLKQNKILCPDLTFDTIHCELPIWGRMIRIVHISLPSTLASSTNCKAISHLASDSPQRKKHLRMLGDCCAFFCEKQRTARNDVVDCVQQWSSQKIKCQ